MKICTIGYEDTKIDEFLAILAENGVDILVDIRATPYSRRKEFSKKNLAAELKKKGIGYIHIIELGSPNELREKVKTDDDYGYFFFEYEKYLRTQPEALNLILGIAREKNVCLLCYEKDVNRCHRRTVAEHLIFSSAKLKLKHL